MSLFAFTTLIGNYSYCEGCLRFILNREVSKTGILVFRIIATVLVFLGAVASASTVWNLADMTQGLMVIVNVPVIILLMKPATDRKISHRISEKTKHKSYVLDENLKLMRKLLCDYIFGSE